MRKLSPALDCRGLFRMLASFGTMSLFHNHHSESPRAIEPVPTVFPAIQGADIAAVFVGNRVAGDFYDSIRVGPERVLIGLMDVAGRRQETRNVLVAAQEIFRNAGNELFSFPDVNEADAIVSLTLQINRGLIEAQSVISCPAFIACYHERLGTLWYTNNGHIPGLLRDATGITELASTGLPLGLFSHSISEARIVAMERAAALLLVSRGVIACEARNSDHAEEFGLDGVRSWFQTAPLTDAHELCASILASTATFTNGRAPCDDETALALIRTA